MTESTLTRSFSHETFEALLSAARQPDWMIDVRRAAWQRFCEMDWPSRRQEEWMRTDIRLFRLDRYGPPGEESGEELPPATLSEGVTLAGSIRSQNGRTVDQELTEKWAERGVVFSSLIDAATSHPDLVQRHLMTRAFDPTYDRFAALHAAFFTGGAFVYVPRGVVVDEPIYIQSGLTDGASDLGHTLVVLEEGAEATVLSELASTQEDASGLHCGGVELIAAPGARLRYVNLQQLGSKVWNFGHQKAVLDRDAYLQWTIGALGSRLSKVNQQVALVGEGAESDVNGVMFTQDKQHLSYHTLQHHEAPHCRSNFLYKAALQDKSRTVWRGMIRVDKAAQKTDGYQRNDNLLLSGESRADAIPGLEIEADDVRCTHGSTTGRVDEEQIFYARSRGFTRKEAIRMIVTGFFQQVFDRIAIESVREALGHAISRRVREYE